MSSISRFHSALRKVGSPIIVHREEGGTECPCRTPEGFRDPAWHEINVGVPLCNEQGFLTTATEFLVYGSIQPATTRYARSSQRVSNLLGDVQLGDKVAVLPCSWDGHTVDLSDWSEAGEDYLLYDSHRYAVVAFDKLADVDGSPDHHYEVGLRYMGASRPVADPSAELFPDPFLFPNEDLFPVAAA